MVVADVTRRGFLGVLGAVGLVGSAGGAVPAAAAGTPLIGEAPTGRLHLMSFNIRYDAKVSPPDPDAWETRRPILAELVDTERPTVLGVQEALYHQVKQLRSDLPAQYEWIGLGREGGDRGEFMAVYYDTRRVEPVAFDHFWLSDTPNVIGSVSWGNTVVRMVTWVRFRDLPTGQEFVCVNTHFDHQSENSRRRSAELVRDRIADFDANLPVVLTGDFNAAAGDSESYRILTGGGLGDCWLSAEQRVTPAWGTFPNYREPVEGAARIDWILANKRVRTVKAAINTFRRDGMYPSDHVPVQALVELS